MSLPWKRSAGIACREISVRGAPAAEIESGGGGKEFSSESIQATMAAISCNSAKRSLGIRTRMYSMNSGVRESRIFVLAVVGVMQLTAIPVLASSLPSDLVSPMMPALAAL
jgi:hypothetical protein